MKQVAIIGAGPMGLYLAYQLKKAGVNPIVLYDPRAGMYVRPGHINSVDFDTIQRALNIKGKATFGHIKEFERVLFKEITKLNIKTEQKKFVRLESTPGSKGIIVQNNEGLEEFVLCDVVFDCTGAERAVIHAVNQTVTPPPFTIQPIANNISVKQHLLAYVKINQSAIDTIEDALDRNKEIDFFTTPEHQVNAINNLRQLGWHQFGVPHIYGMYFGKGKACLYSECPDNLPPESYEAWLKAAIDVATNTTDITFSQLPASKKYAYKPRLTSFEVNPKETLQVAFQNANGLMIIPMGDSQIEPNYTLGHGISDGLNRVNAFINHIETLNGAIVYFDQNEYQASIKGMVAKHNDLIKSQYNRLEQHYINSLLLARKNYLHVMSNTKNQKEARTLAPILKEINARFAYYDALELFAKIKDKTIAPDILFQKLQSLTKLFIEAQDELPLTLRENTAIKLTEMALDLKECGNQFIKANHTNSALTSYQEALKIYQTLPLNAHQKHKLTLQSNIVICYVKLNKITEAVAQGTSALEYAPKDAEFTELRKKLLYNVLISLQKCIKKTSSDKTSELDLCSQMALTLLREHPNLLAKSTDDEFNAFFNTNTQDLSMLSHLKLK